MIDQLLSELDNPNDPLSALAALQLLQQLAEQPTAAHMAPLLADLLIPRLIRLSEKPDLAAGALPVAATLFAAAQASAQRGQSIANGTAALDDADVANSAQLLPFMSQVLDDR